MKKIFLTIIVFTGIIALGYAANISTYNMGEISIAFPTLTANQISQISILNNQNIISENILSAFTQTDTSGNQYLMVMTSSPMSQSEVSSLAQAISNIQTYINAQIQANQTAQINAIETLTLGQYLSPQDIITAMRNIILSAPNFSALQANMQNAPLVNQILNDDGLLNAINTNTNTGTSTSTSI